MFLTSLFCKRAPLRKKQTGKKQGSHLREAKTPQRRERRVCLHAGETSSIAILGYRRDLGHMAPSACYVFLQCVMELRFFFFVCSVGKRFSLSCSSIIVHPLRLCSKKRKRKKKKSSGGRCGRQFQRGSAQKMPQSPDLFVSFAQYLASSHCSRTDLASAPLPPSA